MPEQPRQAAHRALVGVSMRPAIGRIENVLKTAPTESLSVHDAPIMQAGEDVAKTCRWMGFDTLIPSIEYVSVPVLPDWNANVIVPTPGGRVDNLGSAWSGSGTLRR